MTGPWPLTQPELSDEQVLLRAWKSTDAVEVFRACQDPQIQHFTQVPVPYEREHAEWFVEQGPQKWERREGAGFAVVNRSSGRLAGACGLVAVDWSVREAGAGYWVAPWNRSRGVARRALHLLTDWSLSEGGLSRVYLQIEDANPASVAVARAAGFRHVGCPVPSSLKGTERRLVTYEKTGATSWPPV